MIDERVVEVASSAVVFSIGEVVKTGRCVDLELSLESEMLYVVVSTARQEARAMRRLKSRE